MATTMDKTCCVVCDKEEATFKCGGCLQEFCDNHGRDHQQESNKYLDEIEVTRDIFQQLPIEPMAEPNNHLLIQQIDKWEQNSIKKIQQTAEEARQRILKNTNEHIHQMEIKLNKIVHQLKEIRQENDFNGINLHQCEEELKQLTKELTKPSNISIREDSTTFISKISVDRLESSTMKSNIHHDTRWVQNGLTVAGGNRKGNGLNQLHQPVGIFVDDDQTVYVADFRNHRIVEWKSGATDGQVVAGGNGRGNEMNQLNSPTDVILDNERNNLIICDANNRRVVRWSRRNSTTGQTIISNIDCFGVTMDNNGSLYVSDSTNDEVRRWGMNDTIGTLVAGGNGKGNRLNQLCTPTFIFVDANHSVYVSDLDNRRVMKWMKGAKEGMLLAGGQGKGNHLAQMTDPQGLVGDGLDTVYVVDTPNDRIMRWSKGDKQGNIIVGQNEQGENQVNCPMGLSFDRQGNLYVVDQFNHRVQRFNIDQSCNQ